MFEFLKIRKKSKTGKKQSDNDLENNTTSKTPTNHEISIEQRKKNSSSSETPIQTSFNLIKTSVNSVSNSNAVTPRIARRDMMDLEISQLKLGQFVSEFSYEPRKPPYISKSKNYMLPKFVTETKGSRASSTPANRSTSSNRSKDDPIYLSKFAGGYEPDRNKPKRIESLEWLFYDRMSNYEADSYRKNFDSSSPLLRPRFRSIDLKKFPNYQNLIFDSECYDFVSKFKRSKPKDSITSDTEQGDDLCNQKFKHIHEKLHDEIEKISRYENRSSMVADLMPELITHEKDLSRKINIDPWKASRSRNASVEPASRTRYQSPINASPSRICRESCVSSSFSSPYFKRLLGVSSYANGINNVKNGLTTSRSSLTECGSENVFHDEFDIEIKKKLNKKNQSNSSLAGSYQSTLKLANERYYTCKEINVELKPGYGLKKRYQSNAAKMSPSHLPINFKPKNLMKSFEKNSTISLKNKISNSDKDIGILPSSTPKHNQVYTYETLKVYPRKIYPKSIDRKSLEKNLSVQEFEIIFGMNKEQFYELPSWRQIELKKKANLF